MGDGTGQTIAIVDAYNDPNIVQDLQTFDQTFFPGQADPQLTVIGQDPDHPSTLPNTDPSGPGASWAVEESLDVEWAHAIAPGANILLVEANSDYDPDLFQAVQTASQQSGVSVVSMSWASGGEWSGETAYDSYFTQPGVTFVAASGDYGWQLGSVNYPAVSPNVLAVGGTTLTVAAQSYVGESGWGDYNLSAINGGSGGGVSAHDEQQPAYQVGVVPQQIANPDQSPQSWRSYPTWLSMPTRSLACPWWIPGTSGLPRRGGKSAAQALPRRAGPG